MSCGPLSCVTAAANQCHSTYVLINHTYPPSALSCTRISNELNGWPRWAWAHWALLRFIPFIAELCQNGHQEYWDYRQGRNGVVLKLHKTLCDVTWHQGNFVFSWWYVFGKYISRLVCNFLFFLQIISKEYQDRISLCTLHHTKLP
jgi:hypothetical protein